MIQNKLPLIPVNIMIRNYVEDRLISKDPPVKRRIKDTASSQALLGMGSFPGTICQSWGSTLTRMDAPRPRVLTQKAVDVFLRRRRTTLTFGLLRHIHTTHNVLGAPLTSLRPRGPVRIDGDPLFLMDRY